MNQIDSSINTGALSGLAIQPQKSAGSNELGKNEFLELMIAQLNNQNPLDPQDNQAFIAQLAQFSSLEEMQKLTATVDSSASQFRSSQALQASAMVGRSVVVPSETAVFDGIRNVSGFVDLPSSASGLTLSVVSNSGELLNQVDMGPQAAGQIPFEWAGRDSSGNILPPGSYQLKAEARIAGTTESVSTLVSQNVNSVSIAADGTVSLNLSGLGPVSIGDIRQIN